MELIDKVSHKKDLDISDSSRPVTIGTSSVRRQALLGRFYPHVQTVDICGNIQTRVRKMEAGLCDAILMAYAGIHRMDMDDLIVHTFSPDTFIPPAPAARQGPSARTWETISLKTAAPPC